MNQKGFSLIESIVTVALVGLLAAIAIPDYTGMAAQQRFKSAQSELISNIHLAKWIAVNRNNPITLTIQVNAVSGKTEYVTTDNRIPATTFASDVQVIGTLPISIAFNSFGQRTSAINRIELRNKAGHTYKIDISANGKITRSRTT